MNDDTLATNDFIDPDEAARHMMDTVSEPETADTEDPSRVKSLPFLTAMDADALGAPRASPSLAPTLAPAGEEGAA